MKSKRALVVGAASVAMALLLVGSVAAMTGRVPRRIDESEARVVASGLVGQGKPVKVLLDPGARGNREQFEVVMDDGRRVWVDRQGRVTGMYGAIVETPRGELPLRREAAQRLAEAFIERHYPGSEILELAGEDLDGNVATFRWSSRTPLGVILPGSAEIAVDLASGALFGYAASFDDSPSDFDTEPRIDADEVLALFEDSERYSDCMPEKEWPPRLGVIQDTRGDYRLVWSVAYVEQVTDAAGELLAEGRAGAFFDAYTGADITSDVLGSYSD